MPSDFIRATPFWLHLALTVFSEAVCRSSCTGGCSANTHTCFRETYWHILSIHSSFIHFITWSGVCYRVFCTSLFYLLHISWRPGQFRKNTASSSQRLQIITAGEVWRKDSPPNLMVGMWAGATMVENSMEVPLKTKSETTIGSWSPTPGHISGKDENTHLKRYMDPNVCTSTIHNRQDMEATYIPSTECNV